MNLNQEVSNMKTNSMVRAKKTPLEWLKSRKGQQAMIIVLFSLVPLILLFTFTYIPLFKMGEFSFYKMKYIGMRIFLRFNNFTNVFNDLELVGSL